MAVTLLVEVRVWKDGAWWEWQVSENGEVYAAGATPTPMRSWTQACHYAAPILAEAEADD